MTVIAGIGVTVTPMGLHAVAIGSDGAVVAEQRVGGVAGTTALTAALGQLVGSLGGPEVPVAVAWDDGRGGREPVDLGRGRPADVAARLRDGPARGPGRVTIVTDELGGRWAVTIGPEHRIGEAIHGAAQRAGLSLVGSEPIAAARARRGAATVAEAMAGVAAGRMAPSTEVALPAAPTLEADLVWVIERQTEGDVEVAPPLIRTRWGSVAAALRRTVGRRRRG